MLPRVFGKITPVNRSLIFLDWTFFFGWEMIGPIFAIFIVQHVGGTVAQAGFAVAVAWLTRATVQIPLSVLLDRRQGERDEFIMLFLSMTIAGFVALGYYFFATTITAVYALQFVQGIRSSFYGATWPSIFSRHLNHGGVSFQWSLDTSILAFITGVAGAIGGYLANQFGFRILFLLASFLSFSALIPLWGARELLRGGGGEIGAESERQ